MKIFKTFWIDDEGEARISPSYHTTEDGAWRRLSREVDNAVKDMELVRVSLPPLSRWQRSGEVRELEFPFADWYVGIIPVELHEELSTTNGLTYVTLRFGIDAPSQEAENISAQIGEDALTQGHALEYQITETGLVREDSLIRELEGN